MKGEIKVRVKAQARDSAVLLSLLVVEKEGCSLLGRDWLNRLTLDWQQIFLVTNSKLEEVLERHKEVFKEELGTYTGRATKIVVDPMETPRFCKARSVPYAMRERVNDQLKQLEAEGIIQPVTHSDWAAPIVPAVKANNQIRICGDFKQTINRAARVDVYPLPTVEDILATMARGKYFPNLI